MTLSTVPLSCCMCSRRSILITLSNLVSRWAPFSLSCRLFGKLLEDIVHYCPLFSIVIHCCPVLSIVVRCCPLLYNVIHCCPLLSIVVHCCPLLSIVVILCGYHRLPLGGAVIGTFLILLRMFWGNSLATLIIADISHWFSYNLQQFPNVLQRYSLKAKFIMLQFWISSHNA